jgi:isocitrate lyase
VQSGLPLAIAPFGDQSWCELDSASLDDARTFAEGVRAVVWGLLCVYSNPAPQSTSAVCACARARM